jgi:hypothetical protein
MLFLSLPSPSYLPTTLFAIATALFVAIAVTCLPPLALAPLPLPCYPHPLCCSHCRCLCPHCHLPQLLPLPLALLLLTPHPHCHCHCSCHRCHCRLHCLPPSLLLQLPSLLLLHYLSATLVALTPLLGRGGREGRTMPIWCVIPNFGRHCHQYCHHCCCLCHLRDWPGEAGPMKRGLSMPGRWRTLMWWGCCWVCVAGIILHAG